MAVTHTQLWPLGSKVLFRIFCVSFLISIMFNWLELYEVQLAEHGRKMASVRDFLAQCMRGSQAAECGDGLRGCIRFMCTHRDDLCREYFEVVYIDPIVSVPPTKVISITIVSFLMLPLICLLKGMDYFILTPLKDLPAVLQIPASLAVDLILLIVVYWSAKAACSAVLLLYRGRPPQ
ncbi:chloride channel CLIC-like protein 1 [Nelusetta ayraudi]|uniref:chloride channel CLIC-like protein 1 n=1 Tax=Nelusetta ayraudi TaxID=303726 RepID=UPI003F710BBB